MEEEFPFPEGAGALAGLLQPHLAALRRLALRLTASRVDADELIGGVIQRLYVHRYRLAQIRDLRPWLYRVTYYQFMEQRRHGGVADPLAPGDGEPVRSWSCAEGQAGDAAPGPELCAFRLQLKDYLGAALARLGALPAPGLAADALADLDNLSLPEIAVRYGLSVATLKSALAEARVALREQLTAFELISARLASRRSACSWRPAGRNMAYRRMRRRSGPGHSPTLRADS